MSPTVDSTLSVPTSMVENPDASDSKKNPLSLFAFRAPPTDTVTPLPSI